LLDHQPDGRPGPGGAAHLVRAAGADRNLRPRVRDGRRPDHRRREPRRRDPRAADAAHDPDRALTQTGTGPRPGRTAGHDAPQGDPSMSSVAPADRAVTPPPAERPKAGRALPVNLRQSGIYVAFGMIVALFAVLTDGQLLSPQNISNIIVQNSYILILSIGMIMVIIGGHIDLSVGSVVAVTGAIAAVLMVNHDVPWPAAILVTLLAGA